MYHIKKDKRVQTSAQLIGQALIQLLQEKEFNQITITDIQRVSGVGRATFYRLFDNTVDVLNYLTDQTTERILTQHRRLRAGSTKEVVKYFIQEWIQNEALLQAVFDSGHIDVMYRSMQMLTDEGGQYFFPGEQIPPTQKDYIVSLAATAMIGGLSAWLRHGKKETPEEVYDHLENSVNVFYRLIHNI